MRAIHKELISSDPLPEQVKSEWDEAENDPRG
jgi:hypothetical protein